MTKREELLLLLRKFVAPRSKLSESSTHAKAEDLLLDLLGDEEIREAWEEATDHWWYA